MTAELIGVWSTLLIPMPLQFWRSSPKKTGATPNTVIATCRERLRSTRVRESKRKKLDAKGWKIGTAKDFLGMSNEEESYVSLRLRLAEGLTSLRDAAAKDSWPGRN
jgi:hypothetical protein